ncbi:hypothetical protein C8P68_106175 [Mucilaginibacter yixingensis]|uniref:Uncharacterized protein n=1 Tax=Mucilaginibacter yixingensis TaxID=1295612 RepID=A0A2T5J7A6_9SPHI|nr:hypothetical protein C8P68_106175 [Mucilaginibacter yixingensis]
MCGFIDVTHPYSRTVQHAPSQGEISALPNTCGVDSNDYKQKATRY